MRSIVAKGPDAVKILDLVYRYRLPVHGMFYEFRPKAHSTYMQLYGGQRSGELQPITTITGVITESW